MSPAPVSAIGPEQVALMARRVSIIVGTRDAALRPHVMRAVGARLADDRRRLTVLLPQAGSADVLADLRANGRIAVVAASGPDDRDLAARTLEGFVGEIATLGFAPEVALTILGHDDDLVAVQFTIAEAFEQTPGPAAGERLPPAAR